MNNEQKYYWLISKYRRIIYYQINRFSWGFNKVEEDDIFQEIQIRIWKNIANIDISNKHLNSYMTTLIISACTEYLNRLTTRNKALNDSLDELQVDIGFDIVTDADEESDYHRIVDYITNTKTITDRDKDIWLEYYTTDITYQEIGDKHQITKAMVNLIITRINSQIKEQLNICNLS